jgi:hypothetical protein
VAFSRPLGSIGADLPAPVILANSNPESSVQPIPQCNLLGAAVPFTVLQVDEVPLNRRRDER